MTGDQVEIEGSLDYRELYYRWEQEQWEAGAIDLAEDRRQWTDALSPELRRSILWVLSFGYVAAEQATNTLVPYVDAAPSEEQAVFLTTQLVDEARHTVFFDRFLSDVVDEWGSDMQTRLEAHTEGLGSGSRTLLLEMLPAASERIRSEQGSLDALVEGVVLYHLVIQATLALTGRRFLVDFTRDRGLLPGLGQGFDAVARDGSRHAAFGMRFLEEVVAREPRYADVIRASVTRLIPVGLSAMGSSGGDMSYFDPLPYGPEDMTAFALNSLDKRLKWIGVEVAL